MSDINPDNPDGELPELEPLHKVLPTGGPLLGSACKLCGAKCGDRCNLQNCSRADCRMESAR